MLTALSQGAIKYTKFIKQKQIEERIAKSNRVMKVGRGRFGERRQPPKP